MKKIKRVIQSNKIGKEDFILHFSLLQYPYDGSTIAVKVKIPVLGWRVDESSAYCLPE